MPRGTEGHTASVVSSTGQGMEVERPGIPHLLSSLTVAKTNKNQLNPKMKLKTREQDPQISEFYQVLPPGQELLMSTFDCPWTVIASVLMSKVINRII